MVGSFGTVNRLAADTRRRRAAILTTNDTAWFNTSTSSSSSSSSSSSLTGGFGEVTAVVNNAHRERIELRAGALYSVDTWQDLVYCPIFGAPSDAHLSRVEGLGGRINGPPLMQQRHKLGVSQHALLQQVLARYTRQTHGQRKVRRVQLTQSLARESPVWLGRHEATGFRVWLTDLSRRWQSACDVHGQTRQAQ